MTVTIPAVICLIPNLLFYQLFLQPSWHLGVFVASVKQKKKTKIQFIKKTLYIHIIQSKLFWKRYILCKQ